MFVCRHCQHKPDQCALQTCVSYLCTKTLNRVPGLRGINVMGNNKIARQLSKKTLPRQYFEQQDRLHVASAFANQTTTDEYGAHQKEGGRFRSSGEHIPTSHAGRGKSPAS